MGNYLLLEPPFNRPIRSSSDTEEEEDDDDDNVDAQLCSLDFETKSNLALLMSQGHSRDEMRAILQRTLDMMDHRPTVDRSRRTQNWNTTAVKIYLSELRYIGERSYNYQVNGTQIRIYGFAVSVIYLVILHSLLYSRTNGVCHIMIRTQVDNDLSRNF